MGIQAIDRYRKLTIKIVAHTVYTSTGILETLTSFSYLLQPSCHAYLCISFIGVCDVLR